MRSHDSAASFFCRFTRGQFGSDELHQINGQLGGIPGHDRRWNVTLKHFGFFHQSVLNGHRDHPPTSQSERCTLPAHPKSGRGTNWHSPSKKIVKAIASAVNSTANTGHCLRRAYFASNEVRATDSINTGIMSRRVRVDSSSSSTNEAPAKAMLPVTWAVKMPNKMMKADVSTKPATRLNRNPAGRSSTKKITDTQSPVWP